MVRIARHVTQQVVVLDRQATLKARSCSNIASGHRGQKFVTCRDARVRRAPSARPMTRSATRKPPQNDTIDQVGMTATATPSRGVRIRARRMLGMLGHHGEKVRRGADRQAGRSESLREVANGYVIRTDNDRRTGRDHPYRRVVEVAGDPDQRESVRQVRPDSRDLRQAKFIDHDVWASVAFDRTVVSRSKRTRYAEIDSSACSASRNCWLMAPPLTAKSRPRSTRSDRSNATSNDGSDASRNRPTRG